MFAWVISFVLHAVAMWAIVFLYQKIKEIEAVKELHQREREEWEQTLSAFFMEMKDENDRLLQILEPPSPVTESETLDTRKEDTERTHSQDSLTRKKDEVTQRSIQPQELSVPHSPIKHTNHLRMKRAYQPSEEPSQMLGAEEKQIEDNDLHAERIKSPSKDMNDIVALHEKGYTIDEIAQKTQRGKTEIELLLKFSSNRQTFS
ncbi:hypothetical protein [Bacillus fonticola]|uniref:hypothetical protein n=1 Tax=Bacillus fonticola TaxID=2728853 RepID=UPI001475A49C|nr:hypothetical protein [Bacillus fonticola]